MNTAQGACRLELSVANYLVCVFLCFLFSFLIGYIVD